MVGVEVHKSQEGVARTDGPDLIQVHWGNLGLVDDLDLDHRIVGSQYRSYAGTVPWRVQESI